MTRIIKKSVGKSEEYLTHKQLAQEVGERADCAVRAVAIVCDVSYQESLAVFTKLGRKPGHATPTKTISQAIEALGKKPKKLSFIEYRQMVAKYPGKHALKQYITTHHPDRFPQVWRDGKTYLFFTRGHVLCIKNGVNHDWTRGRSLKVTHIWEIS